MREQTGRRGIPFLKKLFLLGVFFVIIASIGLWYLNEYVMPEKGKDHVIDFLTKATGRKVTLENIYYNPFRGVALTGLRIADDPAYKRDFLDVKKLYLNVLYLPIISENKLVITSIRADSVNIKLTIDDTNKWNFDSLLFLKHKALSSGPVDVVINNIHISDATIEFEDLALEPAFKKTLKDVGFTASLSYPLKVKYRMDAVFGIPQDNHISADGEFDPAKQNATLNLKAKNIPFAEFSHYLEGLPFGSLTGNLNGDIGIGYFHKKSLTLNAITSVGGFTLRKEDLSVKGTLDLSGKATIDLKRDDRMPCEITAAVKTKKFEVASSSFSMAGGADANAKFRLDLKNKEAVAAYSADILLKDAKLDGIPEIKSADKINGTLFVDDKKVWTDLLQARIKGLDCVVSGNIKDYAEPHLDLTLDTRLDLSGLGKLLPEDMNKKLKGYNISGSSDIRIDAKGLLKETQKTPLTYHLSAELHEATVKPDFLEKPVTSINGSVSAKTDAVSLKDVTALYDGKKYTLNGDISDLKTPLFDFALSSDDLRLKARFKSLGESLLFSGFEGHYKNTVFDLSGSVSELKEPILDIRGKLTTNIQELKALLPPKEKNVLLEKIDPGTKISSVFGFKGKTKEAKTWQVSFEKLEARSKTEAFLLSGSMIDMDDPVLDIRGSASTSVDALRKYLSEEQVAALDKYGAKADISGKFAFKGRQKDRDSWRADFILESPRLFAKKLVFDDCSIEGNYKNGFLNLTSVKAGAYGGSIAADAVIDTKEQNPPYTMQVSIKDVDLARWKNDAGSKDKDLKGIFYLTGQFNGYGDKIETLRGSGKFAVIRGKVWELPVFAGLANILYIPGVKKIIFGEAKGSFAVGNRVIITGDTVMHAEQMDLKYEGTVDFDGNLDLDITASFDKTLLETASALGPFRDLFVDQAGNFIGRIKCLGTLEKPEYTVQTFPIDRLFQNIFRRDAE